MATFLCRTKNGANPRGKPRVYFTCHPADFDVYFEKICTDIFRTHDCAIYYKENLLTAISQQNIETDLGQINLIVIPVTFRLLSESNLAMDQDYPFAEQRHIPVLPFMMEQGLDALYSLPDKFAERQYINPASLDLTEVPYEEKLRKYLEGVLISDETVKRVRSAFDAYIFLSYRKKDRRYASELMRLIHRQPGYEDVAIWYDEFLSPGESFKENIDRILHDSKLMALLVTPSLLEEPNFVMDQEYPTARNMGMAILPAEMETTDKQVLQSKYVGIPTCINPHNQDAFLRILQEALCLTARKESDNNTEHNFLIGLAYLDGIDVEIDYERGIALITSAAENGLKEAMEKLYRLYYEAASSKDDYSKAIPWAEKLVTHYRNEFGDEHQATLTWENNLAVTIGKAGNIQKSLELLKQTYEKCCTVLGKEHPDTLNKLSNMAVCYTIIGNHQRALELQQQVYTLRCKVLEHQVRQKLSSVQNAVPSNGGDGKDSGITQPNIYFVTRISGSEHPDTLESLCHLASTYGHIGNHKKALELYEQAYTLQCKILGPEHPDTLYTLSELSLTCDNLGDCQRALNLQEKAYMLQSKTLGLEHPDTMVTLERLAITYSKLRKYKEALEVEEKIYALRCKAMGKQHPHTLTALNNIAATCSRLDENMKALRIQDEVYAIQCRSLGEEHPDTVRALSNLAVIHGKLGNNQKCLQLHDRVYSIRCKVLGEEHPDTIRSLSNLAATYGNIGDYQRDLDLQEKVYALRCKVLGAEHPDTVATLENLVFACGKLNNHEKELTFQKKFTLCGVRSLDPSTRTF